MNRIYKVIWSKVKHQYVVVSELAHSCTKSTSSRVGRSAAAVLAALVLTTGLWRMKTKGSPAKAEIRRRQNRQSSIPFTMKKDSTPIMETAHTTL